MAAEQNSRQRKPNSSLRNGGSLVSGCEKRTTTDTLALALSGAAGAVAAVAFGKEKTGTGGKENWKNDR